MRAPYIRDSASDRSRHSSRNKRGSCSASGPALPFSIRDTSDSYSAQRAAFRARSPPPSSFPPFLLHPVRHRHQPVHPGRARRAAQDRRLVRDFRPPAVRPQAGPLAEQGQRPHFIRPSAPPAAAPRRSAAARRSPASAGSGRKSPPCPPPGRRAVGNASSPGNSSARSSR